MVAKGNGETENDQMMKVAVALLGVLLSGSLFAADPAGIPFMSSTQTAAGTAYSLPIQTLLFMTALGFIPAML
jgi:flagellar biosynthesis protein FliP